MFSHSECLAHRKLLVNGSSAINIITSSLPSHPSNPLVGGRKERQRIRALAWGLLQPNRITVCLPCPQQPSCSHATSAHPPFSTGGALCLSRVDISTAREQAPPTPTPGRSQCSTRDRRHLKRLPAETPLQLRARTASHSLTHGSPTSGPNMLTGFVQISTLSNC